MNAFQRSEGAATRSLSISSSEEKYVIVYRWAGIGRGIENDIIIPGAALERTHARILRLGGQFWLENLVDGGRVRVDGVDVAREQASPLAPGMTIDLGDASFEFRPYGQFGL